MAKRQYVPKALTVAGSDSGGGAGIQADLKTFAALGVYGTSAITAITAQNTLSVTRVQALPPVMVKAQIDAIMSDIGADAVKTGMLANAAIVRAVAAKIREHRFDHVVVDPVMVAASGARLLVEEAVETYKRELFPLATVVTPNVPEAEALACMTIRSAADQKEAARVLKGLGPRYVIVKGGHMTGRDSVDLLFDGRKFTEFRAARIATRSNHGTGCTFASAVTASLAHRRSIEDSVDAAKRFVTEAMRTAFPIGRGHGPLNHFHAFWQADGGNKGDRV